MTGIPHTLHIRAASQRDSKYVPDCRNITDWDRSTGNGLNQHTLMQTVYDVINLIFSPPAPAQFRLATNHCTVNTKDELKIV